MRSERILPGRRSEDGGKTRDVTMKGPTARGANGDRRTLHAGHKLLERAGAPVARLVLCGLQRHVKLVEVLDKPGRCEQRESGSGAADA